MRSTTRKAILPLLMILVIAVGVSGRGRAASSITIEVNGGSPLSAATLRGGLDHYTYENILSLTVLEGSLSEADLALLQNKTPQEPDATFLLPNLSRLVIEKAVELPASLPTQFMFQHPALEVLSVRCAVPAVLPELAFAQCRKLKKVELPGVVTIGKSAFRSCPLLAEAELKNVTALGNYAFSDCAALSSVTFGEVAPAAIPDTAFPGHSFLILVPKGQKSTYQQRLQSYTNLVYEEYEAGDSPSTVPKGDVALSGSAQSSYTVAVTPSISFGEMNRDSGSLERTLEVTAEKLFLEEGQQIKATVTSGADGFIMKAGRSSKVPFRIVTGEGAVLEDSGRFGQLAQEGESASGKLILDQGQLPYAGQYAGSLTFEFSLEEKP